jgi:hypothetical protein
MTASLTAPTFLVTPSPFDRFDRRRFRRLERWEAGPDFEAVAVPFCAISSYLYRIGSL